MVFMNSSSEPSSISEDLTYSIKHPLSITVLYCLAYGLIFILGLLGNSLVIAVVIKNPKMQNPTNMFIANLACADLLVILVCVPATLLVNILNGWILGPVLCKAIPWLQGVSVTSSITNLVAIAIDRYLAICQSVHLKQSSQTISRTTIVGMWLFSLAITSPWLSVFKYYTYRLDNPEQLVTTISTFPPVARQRVLPWKSNYHDNDTYNDHYNSTASYIESYNCYTFVQKMSNTLNNYFYASTLGSNEQQSSPTGYVNVCSEEWQNPVWRKTYFLVIIFGLLYIIPVAIITSCYFLIWKKVCHRTLAGPFSYNKTSEDIVKKSKIKVAQLLFFVMIIFIMSWMPLYIYGFRLNFGRETTLIADNEDRNITNNLLELELRGLLAHPLSTLNMSDCRLKSLLKTRELILSLLGDGVDTEYAMCQLAPSIKRGSNDLPNQGNITWICSQQACREFVGQWDASRYLSNIPDERMTTNSYHTHVLSNVIRPLTQWLAFANSCINPILYTFFHKKYRESFKYLLVNMAYSVVLCFCRASPELSERIRNDMRARKSRYLQNTQNTIYNRCGSARSGARISFSRCESVTMIGSSIKSSRFAKRSRHSSRKAAMMKNLKLPCDRDLTRNDNFPLNRINDNDYNDTNSNKPNSSTKSSKYPCHNRSNGPLRSKLNHANKTLVWNPKTQKFMVKRLLPNKNMILGVPEFKNGCILRTRPKKFGRFNTAPDLKKSCGLQSLGKPIQKLIIHSHSLDANFNMVAGKRGQTFDESPIDDSEDKSIFYSDLKMRKPKKTKFSLE